jgi:hypothetical protein
MFTNSDGGFSLSYWLNHHSFDFAAEGEPWVLRLIQIQLSIVYLRTAFWKGTGKRWSEGTAIYYALNVEQVRRTQFPKILMRKSIMKFFAWTVVSLQYSLGTLIWVKEFRLPVVLAGMAMHLGLDFFLNLYLFSYIMIACLSSFIPAEVYISIFKILNI